MSSLFLGMCLLRVISSAMSWGSSAQALGVDVCKRACFHRGSCSSVITLMASSEALFDLFFSLLVLFSELLLSPRTRRTLVHPTSCSPRLVCLASFPAPLSQCRVLLRAFPAAAALTLVQEPVFAEVAGFLSCWVA